MSGGRLGRLRKGAEFDSAFSKGSVMNGPLLVVRVVPNELARSRWGFAVGKKLVPKASRRNLVRRRMREAVRSLDITAGLDVVVVAKAGALDAGLPALKLAIGTQIGRFIDSQGRLE
ncbi:MAG: ribonuclease P protein component [Dehalococcoidia bacterium]